MEALLSMKQEDLFLVDEYNTVEKTSEKTEEMMETTDFLTDEEDNNNCCFSEDFRENIMATAKPMEGLNEVGPTPFLKKTYEMVEDHETDEIISWSGTKKSFIVWDYHHFSTSLLPKHFKHSNFSSFIRQLNTYGFKKIDPDRWEFANEGFQEGKKHLLKSIKRRKQMPQTNSGIEIEFEKLNNDQSKLKAEIWQLKEQEETTQGYLTATKERLVNNEKNQQRMFLFMAKAFSNPGFLHRFVQVLRKEKGICSTQIAKRRRLISPQNNNMKEDEKCEELESEVDMLFSPPLDGEGSSASEGQTGKFTTSSPDFGDENCLSWDKLCDDQLDCENGEIGQSQTNLELELEDLITKPSEHWTNYMRDMVVHTEDEGCYIARTN